MDSDEEILSDFSDSEIVESKHKNLVETISTLDKKSRLKPASRKEPSLQISEYHLVNKGTEEKESKKLVDVQSLVKSLKQKSSNAHIVKKIASVHNPKKNATLPKPLEKIHADKIEREVAFENVKEDISKWDPIVFDNRTADQIKFPLKQIDPKSVEEDQKKEKSHHEFLNTFKKPNQLELALAKLLDSSQVVTQYREEKERREQELKERRERNKNAEFKLTLKEMKEKQKEFTKLRAQKAFKEKKAWMQNKIKSKKYHRLMKREKVKEKLKEFEKLQQTDPEAALQQLELLDKTRAEERITLRHKSTGQWAKNLQVRAKYDKESRIALAEQLAQSRALSQKVKRDDSSEEEGDDSGVEPDEEGNPWMKTSGGDQDDVGAYFSGYRKYWEEKEKGEVTVRPNYGLYGAVSLEKLTGTLDDIHDEDIDMPVFIEAVKPTTTATDDQPTSSIPTSPSKDKPDQSDGDSTGNKTKKRNRKRKSGGNVENTLDNSREDVEGALNKSRVESILDRSGQWTVIPVDDEEESGESENTNKRGKHVDKPGKAKGKSDKNTGQPGEEVSVIIGKESKASRKAKNRRDESMLKVEENGDSSENNYQNGDSKKLSKNKGRLSNGAKSNTDNSTDCDNETPKKKAKKAKNNVEKIDLSTDLAIEQAFDSLEKSWKHKVKHRVQEIAKSLAQQSKGAEEKEENEKEKFDFNDRKRKRKVVEVDEALEETHGGGADGQEENLAKISQLGKEAIMASTEVDKPSNGINKTLELEQIDPNEFLKVDRNANKLLSRKMPQILQDGALDDENDEDGSDNDVEIDDNTQQMTIEEAFADDDVVQEFRQDKEEAAKDSKGGDIDLSLPGWGAWGGAGISKEASKRKRRRFMIKGAQLPRKDETKPVVIINEDTTGELKKHLVDEVPHPFTSVKEYEASLRAPLGREWVPELAHRKLTQPAIRTKLGALIEPIDYESQTRTNMKEYR
ncbi:hypothetical protein M8J77_016967 [Diaphorina citri]|nr:hypothetical protein M8J77_016967 [Diaphorina citri]